MSKFNHGGVQPHSVGAHYPVIVVGYGDGTWRAEYGGARSDALKSATHAEIAAVVAHHRLVAAGGAACKSWLENDAGNYIRANHPADYPSTYPKLTCSEVANGLWEVYFSPVHRRPMARTYRNEAIAKAFNALIELLITDRYDDDAIIAHF